MLGQYLVIDIGTRTTKVARVSVIHNVASLREMFTISGMHRFYIEGKLSGIGDFLLLLTRELKSRNIAFLPVVLTGSVFDARTVVKTIKPKKDKYSRKQINDQILESADTTKHLAFEWHPSMTITTTDVATVQVTLNRELLVAIQKEFARFGYRVVHIENQDVSILHYLQYHACTFDINAIFAIKLGKTTKAYEVFNGVPLKVDTLDVSFTSFFEDVAKECGCSAASVSDAYMLTGYLQEDDSSRDEQLRLVNIDPIVYRQKLNVFVFKLEKAIQTWIESRVAVKVRGYTIHILGGFANDLLLLDKLNEYLGFNVVVEPLEKQELQKYRFHRYKTSELIQPQFYTLLGALSCKPYKVNFIKLASVSVSSMMQSVYKMRFGYFKRTIGTCLTIAGIVLMCLTGYLVYSENIIQVFLDRGNSYQTMQSLQADLSSDVNFSKTVQLVDTKTFPLISFLNENQTPSLVIASLDTPDQLKGVKTATVTNSGVTVASSSSPSGTAGVGGSVASSSGAAGGTAVSGGVSVGSTTGAAGGSVAGGSVAGGSAGVAGAAGGSADVVGAAVTTFTIRGYAVTQADITNFYNKLVGSHLMNTVTIMGIEQVTLPTKEPILMFDMSVTEPSGGAVTSSSSFVVSKK